MTEPAKSVMIPIGKIELELRSLVRNGHDVLASAAMDELRSVKAQHYRDESRRVAQIPPHGRDDQGN